MSDGGKGSSPRPKSVDVNTFASNWELAFGKKKKSESETPPDAKDEYYDLGDKPADSTQGG